MLSILKYLAFGIVLLGVGYTTNVTSVPETTPRAELATAGTAKNCTPLTFFRVFSCVYRLGDFLGKMYFLNIEKKSSLEGFHKSCVSLQECLGSLACGKTEQKDIDMVNKMASYCSGLKYMFEEFRPCLDKFEEKDPDSECFLTWSPFLQKENNGTERTQEEICNNFFGEKNCMKKEISEVCSQEQWQDFRNHFLKITPEVKDCKLEDL